MGETSDLLQRVHAAFSPEPLLPTDTELYVDLDDVRGTEGFVQQFRNSIRLDPRTCQLLSGHRRSGKTTELRRLQNELESRDPCCFVVFCEIDEDVDRNDVDFPDVLVALVRQMAAQLKDRQDLSLGPGMFRGLFERIGRTLGGISLERFELGPSMLRLSGAIKSSPDARSKIRELLEPDTNNWIAAANDVIGDAKSKLKKKGFGDLVIMVDDLDKMVIRPHATSGTSTAEYLFVHREAQLSAFLCHVI